MAETGKITEEKIEEVKAAVEKGATEKEIKAILFDSDYVKKALGEHASDDEYRAAFDEKMGIANQLPKDKQAFEDAFANTPMAAKFFENLGVDKNIATALIKAGYTQEMFPQAGDKDFEKYTALILENDNKRGEKAKGKEAAKKAADGRFASYSKFSDDNYKDKPEDAKKFREFIRGIDNGLAGGEMSEEDMMEFFGKMKGYSEMDTRIAQEREDATVTANNKKIEDEFDKKEEGDGFESLGSGEAGEVKKKGFDRPYTGSPFQKK